MADKDKSVDNIQEQIRRLLEEKEELERRNREKQQLEQRSMKDNVLARSSSISGDRRSFGNTRDYGDLSFDLNTSVESQRHHRSLQQNVHNSSMDGAPTLLNDSRDSQKSADDAEDDDVMSPEHKQALRANRDVLVENMTPDDIFNDLISKHILTNADVSRIKDKNTIEAINEELLNVLIRRSDRAFYVFVASLRRTLQGWLANRIDPGSPQKTTRKRRTGEINVNLSCERIVPVTPKQKTCSCQEVEEQVLVMAKAAFAHIRRRDGSASAFEQFKKEVKQTNEVLRESVEIVNALKLLCRHGDITNITMGSACFTIRCSSFASCQALWKLYESGVLLQVFQQAFVTSTLLQICKAKQIHLYLRMSRLEYLSCALELAYKEKEALELKQSKSLPIKRRLKKKLHCSQKENAAEETIKVFRPNKRKAFQEIAVNTMLPTNLTYGKSYEDKRCGGITHTSETQHSTAASTHETTVEKSSIKQLLQHQTVPEYVSESNIWLRSCSKETPGCHKHGLNQVEDQGGTSEQINVNHQAITRGTVDGTRNQQDGCPYNLRCRLMNA